MLWQLVFVFIYILINIVLNFFIHCYFPEKYRRAQSADPQQRNKVTTKPANKLTSSTSSLTAEESRILSQLRDDFERRGEFNRIFPSETSWSLYGDFIETLYSSSPGLSSTGSNFNRMVHDQLYPPSQNQANQCNSGLFSHS